MVRNTMGGKKAKKMKNSGPVQKATIYPDEEQYYAIVEKFYSHSNIDLYFVDIDEEDGKERLVLGLGIIRGSLIKRLKRVAIGDIFIVSKREFETAKKKPTLDILHAYKPFERNGIIAKLPEQLRYHLNNQSTNSKNNKNTENNFDSNSEDDDIIFAREEKEKIDKRKRRHNTGPKSNTVTNDYLAGFDLPESDDGFTTDDEPFEGTDEEYFQKRILDRI